MIQMVSNESESHNLIWGYQDKRKAYRLMIPYTDVACKETDQLYVWKKGKYLNGILLFSVLMSICTGRFYRFPCPTGKPRKKSSVCRKRNVKLLLHFSLLACNLCLEMERILNDQLQLEKFPSPSKLSLTRCTQLWFVSSWWSHLIEFPLLS